MKIGLIACCKTKKEGLHRAEELYQSDLFKKSLAYAKREYDKVFILSAKYGLVDLNEYIENYDLTLNTMPKKSVVEWSAMVAESINEITTHDDDLYFLAGKNYYQYMPLFLNNQNMYFVFGNKALGQRQQWLKEQLGGE